LYIRKMNLTGIFKQFSQESRVSQCLWQVLRNSPCSRSGSSVPEVESELTNLADIEAVQCCCFCRRSSRETPSACRVSRCHKSLQREAMATAGEAEPLSNSSSHARQPSYCRANQRSQVTRCSTRRTQPLHFSGVPMHHPTCGTPQMASTPLARFLFLFLRSSWYSITMVILLTQSQVVWQICQSGSNLYYRFV
jgi:hypothetical protein